MSPLSLEFQGIAGGSNPPSQSLSVSQGPADKDWTAVPGASWIRLSATRGRAPDQVRVYADIAGLGAGPYSGGIVFTSGKGVRVYVQVTLTLSAPSVASPAIQVSPTAMTFNLVEGGAPASQTISIKNSGGGALAWTAYCNAPWLSFQPAYGTAPSSGSVTVNPGNLAPGSYTGRITVSSSGAANSPQAVSVNLTVTSPPGQLQVSPTSLSFTVPQGSSPASQSLSISYTGSGSVSWSATDNHSWLSLQPASGATPGSLVATVDPAGVAAGTYSAQITVSAAGAGNSPQTIPVSLTVTPPPGQLQLSPATLNFTLQSGAPPDSQSFSISYSGSGSLNWTATESAAWLSLQPASGSTPGSGTATVNPSGLQPGTYSTQIMVSALGASNTPQTITVNLTVTSPSQTTPSGSANPTLLPVATGQQTPANTPGAGLAGGSYYLEPTSGVRVWRVTSATYPFANGGAYHDYADGANQISSDLGGGKHTLLVNVGGSYRLVDFTRGQGFSNWRAIAAGAVPDSDTNFTFSSNPATPHIAYSIHNSSLVRYNTQTNQIENVGNFPKLNWTSRGWLQQDKNDEWFVAIRAAGGGATAWNSQTNVTIEQTWPNFDEPHQENNGRYVILITGDQGAIWDLYTNTVAPITAPSGRIFHNASPAGFFTSFDVDTGLGKTPFYRLDPATRTGTWISNFGGYKPDHHHAGQWIQPGVPETQQWFLISTYGTWVGGAIDNAVGFMRLDGSDIRFLAHTFATSPEYWQIPRATISPDGKVVVFDSNMRGSRGDVYLVEVPVQ